MTAKKKRLGRGLDALLSKPVAETTVISGGEEGGPLKEPKPRLSRGPGKTDR